MNIFGQHSTLTVGAIGDRSFSVAGPCLRYFLPVTLSDRDISVVQFKKLLKTRLFV